MGTDWSGSWGGMWWGAVFAGGYVYSSASASTQLLRFDPATELSSKVGDSFGSYVEGKYNGLVKGADGALYAVPKSSSQMSRFEPAGFGLTIQSLVQYNVTSNLGFEARISTLRGRA